MRRSDGLDAAFLAFETPTMHMHVCAVMILEPAEDGSDTGPTTLFNQMQTIVQERLHLVPALRRRPVRVPFGLQHAVWVEDPFFDLDFHLRRAALPAPGGWRELKVLVSEIAGRPLDSSRPLWEMHLVEGLESGHVAVVVKLHHAVIDGASGAEVLATFMDLGPISARVDPPARAWRPEPIPSDIELVGQAISSMATSSERVVGSLRRTFGVIKDLTDSNRRIREEDEVEPPPAPFRAPRTSLNGAISAHRRFTTCEIPLSDVRSVAHSFGAKINDVVLAVCSGALRQLLDDRGEEVPDLVGMVPIAVGDRSQTQAVNKLSAMLVSLGSSQSDSKARMQAVTESARLAKDQARLLPPDLVQTWAQFALPAVTSRIARLAGNLRLFDFVQPLFNVVVSNVAGPDFPLWCAGGRLVALYPVGPIIEGVGLNITVFSYLDTLYFGITACREMIPEVEHLASLVADAFSELHKAAAQAP